MRILLPLALIASAVFATTAVAATLNGLTPVSPKAGSSVTAGKSASFRVRSTGAGTVWVHVCKSRRKNAKGVICNKQFIGQAKKRSGVFTATQRFFDYPEFWLNNPGTYYWQAHRIECKSGSRDCLQEGPVVRFRVR